jgi:hypothetical protein
MELSQSVKNIKSMWYIKYYDTTLKNKEFYDSINLVYSKGLALVKKVNDERNTLGKTFTWTNDSFKSFETQVFKNYLKKALLEEKYKIYYKQLFHINRFKFQDTYLLRLKDLISKLFYKKVGFNIINLRSFYLSSDIFTSAIALVLRKRENSIAKVLTKAVEIIKYDPFNKLTDLPSSYDKPKQLFSDNVLYINAKLLSILEKNKSLDDNDLVSSFLENTFKPDKIPNNYYLIEQDVFSNLRYKVISGVALQANGRLTRRLIAARSVYKRKTVGSIKNIDSSYRGLYSPVFFGHATSNVQYSKAHYKNRNGSFGIKGWVSSK